MTVQPAYRISSIKAELYPVPKEPYKRKIIHMGPEKQPITRPPSTYSNQSHEDVLNFYWDQLDAKEQSKFLKEMSIV
jgi:hypothetical protein